MRSHPHLFEINLRVLLNQFGEDSRKIRLIEVPDSYWQTLRDEGIDMIWLMGIWQICPEVVDQCCFEEGLVASYGRALKDWVREDVAGSPYSVSDYKVDQNLCTEDELLQVRDKLHSMGMQLILDFIPNHFSAASEVIESHPNLFLEVAKNIFEADPHTFYKPKFFSDRYFAHGRDPFFPSWTDTIQLNYFNADTRVFMKERLESIARYCDGVRCDMAMLNLSNVFHNTWRGVIKEEIHKKPEVEFWEYAIKEIKQKNPGFLFIAESYWDLEWDLQQLGFDFTYDKKFLDRLKDGSCASIRDHLKADPEYQTRSVRFIENHDEDRAVTSLGREKSLAAAMMISTVPGMRMFFQGQPSGKKVKLPVQLIREPREQVNRMVKDFYLKVFSISDRPIFHEGEFSLLKCDPAWFNNLTHGNIIAYSWSFRDEHAVVAINYSGAVAQCRLKINIEGRQENFELRDILNDKNYIRSSEEVHTQGLFIELAAYQSHVFIY